MNIWKWISIILIALNISFLLWLYVTLSGDYNEFTETDETNTVNESDLYAILPNATVEALINEYLSSSDDANLEVNISTDNITLHSRDEILGMTVNTTFNIVPIVEEDQIIFQVSNIDIGNLPLSQDSLYSIIVNASNLPEGVQFSDEDRALIINTQIFEEELTDTIQIETIDYENDEWYFSIKR